MTDTPPWLAVMQTLTGTKEVAGPAANPVITGMTTEIARIFPEMKTYCDQSAWDSDETAWCGVAAAYCMAEAGIKPPFGATDTDRFGWAQSWAKDPGYEKISKPRLGCVVVLSRSGGGHVTFYESTSGSNYMCRGGNQSNSVNLAPQAIANVIGLYWPVDEAIPLPPPDTKRTLKKGDTGSDVAYMQELIPKWIDGDFGTTTESLLKEFQRSEGLEIDGVCGPQTWAALTGEEPPPPVPAPGELPAEAQDDIKEIAKTSSIAAYSWKDRGKAPAGYTQGMALAFATSYRRLKGGDSVGVEMAKANTHNDSKDAISWYNSDFKAKGMTNETAGPDTLRHLYVLLLGLGMRESSGKHCEGRDMSATNTTSDTCEAGLFQTSYNAHTCSGQFDKLFSEASAGQSPCYLEAFKQGVSCSASSWSCYGSGNGLKFQELCKSCPTFAAETCAITLRNLRQHYGPINRKEAEIKTEADQMFLQVQEYVDQMEAIA